MAGGRDRRWSNDVDAVGSTHCLREMMCTRYASAMAIARFSLVALDCPNCDELAGFYQQITGWELEAPRHPDWRQLRSNGGATIAFQQVDSHRPPTWPEGDIPQQAHLDFDVPDLDEGERQILSVGARKAEVQPSPDSFRVYLDPAGHPFCLVKA